MSALTLRNQGIDTFKYKYTNADVFFLGSSHAYCNFNATTLWNTYGIAAVSLAQPSGPVNMSYYVLEEALRYHKPKLVIMETYMLSQDLSYDQAISAYDDALLYFPIWRNADLRVKALTEFKGLSVRDEIYHFLGFPITHNNYKDLWGYSIDDGAGFEYLYDFIEKYQVDDYKVKPANVVPTKLAGDREQKLKRIIALCKKNNIEILLLLAPYQDANDHLDCYERIRDIADSEGVAYLDMNEYVNEIGLDFSAEMRDNGHAMITGSDKNSVWLGRYIKDHYQISDRRGDTKYEKWNRTVCSRNCSDQEALRKQSLENMIRVAANDDLHDDIVLLDESVASLLQESNAGLFCLLQDKMKVASTNSQYMVYYKGNDNIMDSSGIFDSSIMELIDKMTLNQSSASVIIPIDDELNSGFWSWQQDHFENVTKDVK